MILSTMKYRSRTEIIVSMLEAARHGGPVTKIVYLSYLSSHQLRTYLELAISSGLLQYDSAKQRYGTTERGLRLLEMYGSIGSLELAPSAWTSTQKQENTLSE